MTPYNIALQQINAIAATVAYNTNSNLEAPLTTTAIDQLLDIVRSAISHVKVLDEHIDFIVSRNTKQLTL